MADLLRVYNGETLIAEQASPVNLIGLTPETTYNLQCAWFNGLRESTKTAVPAFTTTATPAVPVLPTAMTVDGNSRVSKVGNTKNITITFAPVNTTDISITWTFDDNSAFEYIPVPNDNILRLKTLKQGTHTVTITSVANPALTQIVTFTVNP